MMSTTKCKISWTVVLLVALWTSVVVGQNKYADRVRDCYLKDKTKFNDCLMQFWYEIKPIMKNGIAELKVPPIDPMFIPFIDFNEVGSVVQGKASFNNVKVVGLGEFIPKYVTVDTKSRLVKVALRVPAMYISGTYNIDGVVLLLPVKGHGPFALNLTGVDGLAIIHTIQKGTGIRASKIDVSFSIEKISVNLDGLFGGDAVGDAVNNMINDNAQSILDDVKPNISEKLGDAIIAVLGDAFIDMPSEAFIN